MKIAIDIQTTLGEKTGFGFYVENLIKNLKIIDKKNDYLLVKPDKKDDLNAPQRFFWDQFGFPQKAIRKNSEIIHQPCFSAPVMHGKMKVVVTIHDIIAIKYGKDHPFFARLFFSKWMPSSYRYADKIICDSENTKKDIIEELKIPESKIKVIYLAVGKEYNNCSDKNKVEKIKKKYNIGNKYFLDVGTLNPRKNIQFLLKVFSQIVKEYPEYNLVVTGKKGWYYEKLISIALSLGIKNKVIFTGYVPDEDAPYLYKGADIFLYPSLYEGFGLPPLEAMSSGVPVISSNASSLPEVVGNGGILISPNDEFGWVRNIKEMIKNNNIRNSCIEKGISQSKKFSWEKCAKETLKVYEDVYGGEK